MMDHRHVDEAAKLLASLKWCADALTWTDDFQGTTSMYVVKSTGMPGRQLENQQINITRKTRAIAFRAWRDEVIARQAEYRRRAAQINLRIDGL